MEEPRGYHTWVGGGLGVGACSGVSGVFVRDCDERAHHEGERRVMVVRALTLGEHGDDVAEALDHEGEGFRGHPIERQQRQRSAGVEDAIWLWWRFDGHYVFQPTTNFGLGKFRARRRFRCLSLLESGNRRWELGVVRVVVPRQRGGDGSRRMAPQR